MIPATADVQQWAADAALCAKSGEAVVEDFKGGYEDMYDSMSERELADVAANNPRHLTDHAADD